MNLDCGLQLSRLWHSSIKTVKHSYIIVFQCYFNVSLHPPAEQVYEQIIIISIIIVTLDYMPT